MPDDATLEDVTPGELQDDYVDSLQINLPTWRPSPAAPEVAAGAAFAEEAAELYSLVQQDAVDASRDYGAKVERVIPDEAYPATSSTTWTAGDTLGHTIAGGTLLRLTDDVDLEVVTDTEIPAGESIATGVLVQAAPAGAAANGLTGDLALDDPPSWLTTVVLEDPLTGGVDAETDADYDERLSRVRYARSDAVVSPAQVEALALTIPGIERCLVIKGYDLETSTPNVPLNATAVPIDAEGEDAGATAVQRFAAELADRSPDGVVMHIAHATRTPVTVAITVAAYDDVDPDFLEATVQATIAKVLFPGTFGDNKIGETRTWSATARKVHRYDVAAAVSAIEDVEYVDALTLNGSSSADVSLTGIGPLPQLSGSPAVTIIAPS